MRKFNYEAPEMELISLGAEDIIRTSDTGKPHFVAGNEETTYKFKSMTYEAVSQAASME